MNEAGGTALSKVANQIIASPLSKSGQERMIFSLGQVQNVLGLKEKDI